MTTPAPPATHAAVYECFGLRIRLRASSASLLRRLVDGLPPGARKLSAANSIIDRDYLAASPSGLELRRDGRLRARPVSPKALTMLVEDDLHRFVAEHARGLVFVHAGAVAWRGRGIVLPGRSRAGKSTLVHALVRAGATLYSDEYAVIDSRGRLHPFARPLSLRRRDPLAPPRRVSAGALGARVGRRPVGVALVLVTTYQPATRLAPDPLSPGRAVLALLRHTVPARARAPEALDALAEITTRARLYAGARGEATESCAVIRRLMGSRS